MVRANEKTTTVPTTGPLAASRAYEVNHAAATAQITIRPISGAAGSLQEERGRVVRR